MEATIVGLLREPGALPAFSSSASTRSSNAATEFLNLRHRPTACHLVILPLSQVVAAFLGHFRVTFPGVLGRFVEYWLPVLEAFK